VVRLLRRLPYSSITRARRLLNTRLARRARRSRSRRVGLLNRRCKRSLLSVKPLLTTYISSSTNNFIYAVNQVVFVLHTTCTPVQGFTATSTALHQQCFTRRAHLCSISPFPRVYWAFLHNWLRSQFFVTSALHDVHTWNQLAPSLSYIGPYLHLVLVTVLRHQCFTRRARLQSISPFPHVYRAIPTSCFDSSSSPTVLYTTCTPEFN
jgi:hypothetical protein